MEMLADSHSQTSDHVKDMQYLAETLILADTWTLGICGHMSRIQCKRQWIEPEEIANFNNIASMWKWFNHTILN